jgi:UDP-glucose 4-epimerase
MSRVFITGVAGFLGSHLADKLLSRGHSVLGVDNLLGGYEDNVSDGVEFREIDARYFDKLRPLMKGVEVVYHCAAAPHEGLSVFSPNLVTEHTYNTTVATVSAAVAEGVKRVVFCSSMARYGAQDKLPFTEDMMPKPQDPYGVAKYASEIVTKILCETHGLEYTHAVPHNIIGPRQKYDDPFRNVASIMINLMLQGRQPIIYGDGEQKRAFSFVADVIEPLVKMGFDKSVVGEVINVGPDEEFITINELSRRIANLIGFKNLSPVYVGERPQEVRYAACSADKSRRLLEYKTTYNLDRGLSEMIAWIRGRGPKPFGYHLPLEIVNDKTPKTWKEKMF